MDFGAVDARDDRIARGGLVFGRDRQSHRAKRDHQSRNSKHFGHIVFLPVETNAKKRAEVNLP
jgi:hypothetical protein